MNEDRKGRETTAESDGWVIALFNLVWLGISALAWFEMSR